MKKTIYSLIMIMLIILGCNLRAIYIYIQNDAGKPIEYLVNNMGKSVTVKPGELKPISALGVRTLYAKYLNGIIYRNLSLGNAIQDANEKDISSILHVIPGTLYGVKIGKIDKRYDYISIPLNDKMKVLEPLGLTLKDVDVPTFSKALAAKILGISMQSTFKQAEDAFTRLANKDRGNTGVLANYRGYLYSKALRAFQS